MVSILRKSIKQKFNCILKLFRPHEWRVYIFFTLIGFLYSAPETKVTPINLARLIISTTCYLSLSYWINNAYDIESDILNPQLKGYNIFIEKTMDRKAVWIIAISLFTMGLYTASHSLTSQINYLTMSILSILYSTPPIRLKEKPPLDLISHAFFFGNQLFLHGYLMSHTEININIIQIIILISIYSITLQLRNHIEDYNADLKAGYKTTATRMGIKKSFFLMNILTLTLLTINMVIMMNVATLIIPAIILTLTILQVEGNILGKRRIDVITAFTILLLTFKNHLNENYNLNSLQIVNSLQSNLNDIIDYFKTLGLIGVFLASFIGNATPYAGLPYLLVVIEYSSIAKLSASEIITVTLLGGLGSAIGKMIIMLMGYALNTLLSEEVKIKIQKFSRIFERSLFTAIFLFAALPLPDDILYVPLSISKYNPYKFFIAVFLGKTIIVGATVIIGRGLGIATGENPILAGIISIILSITLLILIIKLNWEKIALKANDIGWLKIMIELLRNPSEYLK